MAAWGDAAAGAAGVRLLDSLSSGDVWFVEWSGGDGGAVQAAFDAARDPAELLPLLRAWPLNVGGLLALATAQRTTQQHEQAAATLRRVAYALEAAAPSNFWNSPAARLAEPSSPPAMLFLRALAALQRHAGRGAAPRSATELSLLLLRLTRCQIGPVLSRAPTSPSFSDETRSLLFLDSYALRAGMHALLLRATAAVAGLTLCRSRIPVSLLPGWAFSRALAAAREPAEAARVEAAVASSAAATAATSGSGAGGTADLHDLYARPALWRLAPPSGAGAGATAAGARYMVEALLLFPHALPALAAASRADVGGGTWKARLSRPLFADAAAELARDGSAASSSPSSSLGPLVRAFAARHGPVIWAAADAASLLRDAADVAAWAADVAEAVDAAAGAGEGAAAAAASAVPAPSSASAVLVAAASFASPLAAAAAANTLRLVRVQAYGSEGTEGAALRHYASIDPAELSDDLAATFQLAPEGDGEGADGVDGGIARAPANLQRLRAAQQGAGVGGVDGGGARPTLWRILRAHWPSVFDDEVTPGLNPVLGFLQSLLPWKRLPGTAMQPEWPARE